MPQLFLIAHIAGRAVAIDSTQVSSVVDIGPVVPVPQAGAHIRGLTALRSRVVTVVDTRAVLGLPSSAQEGTRAIITRIDGHDYAVLVDTLEDVAAFDLKPLSGGIILDERWRASGYGLVERDGEPVLAIDLRAIVPGQMPIAA